MDLETHADPNASARHWLVWTFSSGTMSHTDRHLFCYLLHCQNDSLLSPSPRRSMCRPKRVALRSVFSLQLQRSAYFWVKSQNITSSSESRCISAALSCALSSPRCWGQRWGFLSCNDLLPATAVLAQMKNERRRKRRLRSGPLATREAI